MGTNTVISQNIIGTTVWSRDRVFLGQIVHAKAAPDGQVDARLRLGAGLGASGDTLIRLNPRGIRNGQLKIKMRSEQFLERISK